MVSIPAASQALTHAKTVLLQATHHGLLPIPNVFVQKLDGRIATVHVAQSIAYINHRHGCITEMIKIVNTETISSLLQEAVYA